MAGRNPPRTARAVGIAVLLVLAVVVACAEAKSSSQKRQAKRDRSWKARKRDCERATCGHMPALENDNCVNECTSPACYQLVYGKEPLEPGEIDPERYRGFTKCVRDEARREARAASEARAEAKRRAAAEAAGKPYPPDAESASGSGSQADSNAASA